MRAGRDDSFRCVPEGPLTSKEWTLRMNGFPFKLQGNSIKSEKATVSFKHLLHPKNIGYWQLALMDTYPPYVAQQGLWIEGLEILAELDISWRIRNQGKTY